MILSDLLSRPVLQDGERVGYVLDARFVLAGPARSGLLADAELLGLVVGPRPRAGFLGFERLDERPSLIRRALRQRQHGAFLVDWRDVDGVDEGGVVLASGCPRWSAVLPGR